MSRPVAALLAGSTLITLAACAAQTPAPSAVPPPAGVQTITPQDIYTRVAFLASDALRGRDTPSPGLDTAAAYLVSEYRRLGLRPAGENGSFYQHYPFPLLGLDTAGVHLGTVVGGQNRMLTYGTDFFVAAVPAASGAEMGHAKPVYVGRLGEQGLPAGDYRGTAPMVVVPGGFSRDWRTTVARARAAAQEAGAAALMVITAPEFPAGRFRDMAQAARNPQRRLTASSEIPVLYLSHAAAQSMLARAGQDLVRLAASPGAAVPLPGLEAHFAAQAQVLDRGLAPNVAAVLPGSDPALRDEYVILSAHMDHVGVGRPVNGDSIYNGADDDASGTAALVEVAEALASLPASERPRRSVIFLHVSGEEHGLLGSRWYSDHPTVPLERVVANLNVDMIARNAPDSVVVIGKEYSSLGRTINQVGSAHPELGLVVSDDIWPEERFFFRSDHFNFARKEIPALFFFTGVHEDYHRPSDEVDKLDVDKASRVARLIFHTTRAIADDPQRPQWDPKGLQEVRALTR